ncbi:uncharacterized protein LOC125284425 [Alosa alosa]|uniref:uncharacterized protein LOC125284425 n=1 Tax=Alosa alosa TaxID=278164 RepID=UPI00201503F7|nr:uncharacterized protein LOC125284425 [Alosa alosa]
MASLLLLLHLLPPTAGRKRRTKISPSDAVHNMVHFHKCVFFSTGPLFGSNELPVSHAAALMRTCKKERVNNHTSSLLAKSRTGLTPSTSQLTNGSSPHCSTTSSLSAFDKLFKSHYVFNLSYEESLVHLYTFVQTTVFNIDVTSTDESPRVRAVCKCATMAQATDDEICHHAIRWFSLAHDGFGGRQERMEKQRQEQQQEQERMERHRPPPWQRPNSTACSTAEAAVQQQM